MNLEGKTVVITGAASGIGRAVSEKVSALGANLVMSDLNPATLQEEADKIGAHAIQCDVTDEQQVIDLISRAEKQYGHVDLFFSNAGIGLGEPDHAASATNDIWQKCFDVHVMAQVYAARALLPSMISRGDGYLVNMASAAGLLNQIGDAAYSATKHASVGFSEALAITHGEQGVKVSVVCPQYVATSLTGYKADEDKPLSEGTITADDAAEAIVKGIEREEFLILTHPQVHGYVQNRAADHNQWITGMQKLRAKIVAAVGGTRLQDMHKLL